MWVIRFSTLIILISLCSGIKTYSQQTNISWGFCLAPGFSNSKLPSGVSVSYPGPPFYVDLVMEEPNQFNFGLEVFLIKKAFSKFNSQLAIGFSTYGYRVNYYYDHQQSTANNIYDRRKFAFIEGGYRLGRDFRFNNFYVEPYVGIYLNYAIQYRAIFLNIVNGEERLRDFNMLGSAQRLNASYEVGISLRKKIDEKFTGFVRPSFQQFIREYEDNGGPPKKLYSFAIGLGLIVHKN